MGLKRNKWKDLGAHIKFTESAKSAHVCGVAVSYPS